MRCSAQHSFKSLPGPGSCYKPSAQSMLNLKMGFIECVKHVLTLSLNMALHSCNDHCRCILSLRPWRQKSCSQAKPVRNIFVSCVISQPDCNLSVLLFIFRFDSRLFSLSRSTDFHWHAGEWVMTKSSFPFSVPAFMLILNYNS